MVKFLLYLAFASLVICGWTVLVSYMREMNKRVQRLEVLTDRNCKQQKAKAEMGDSHIISLATELVTMKHRIEYAEAVIGYKYPEKEDSEC